MDRQGVLVPRVFIELEAFHRWRPTEQRRVRRRRGVLQGGLHCGTYPRLMADVRAAAFAHAPREFSLWAVPQARDPLALPAAVGRSLAECAGCWIARRERLVRAAPRGIEAVRTHSVGDNSCAAGRTRESGAGSDCDKAATPRPWPWDCRTRSRSGQNPMQRSSAKIQSSFIKR